MEEGEDLKTQIPAQNSSTPNSSGVGFPQAKLRKKKRPYLLFIIIALAILAAAGYFLFTKPKNIVEDAQTDESGIEIIDFTPSPTTTMTQMEKADVSIEVLNGTGISGAAGDLQKKLEALGFSDIEADNADNKDYRVTEVRFSTKVDDLTKEEILTELKGIYDEVSVESGSTGSYEVQIITGYPKGYTATPTKAATTPTKAPTGTTTTTVTLTPTQTPTPTP